MKSDRRFRVKLAKREEEGENLYLNVFYEAGRLQYEFTDNKEESFEVMTIFTDRDLEDLPDKDYLKTLPKEFLEEDMNRTEDRE